MSELTYKHIGTLLQRLGQWKTTTTTRNEHTVTFSKQAVYRFRSHFHSHAERFLAELALKDVEGFQELDTGALKDRTEYFAKTYGPARVVPELTADAIGDDPVTVYAPKRNGLPAHEIDFDYAGGAYAVYNWELFFHVPHVLGTQLSKNGRYAEAQRWFHYIFDPTDKSDPSIGPKRFWKVKPFQVDEVEHIEATLLELATGGESEQRSALIRAIEAWRQAPFRPHLVARTRPTAYMYATVMAYLDNLIAWGDSLFREDTRESIDAAMQQYVLAANILGPRPQKVPRVGTVRPKTYADLRTELDAFSNAAVEIEADLGFDTVGPAQAGNVPDDAIIESIGRTLYFCVPSNQKLASYWDTVADRLFKIRNSLNLQGVFRQLPLFAPPIDPAMLARATAAGVDVAALLSGGLDGLAPPAPVRFPVLLQRAIDLAQKVEALGAQILQALEKKDGERLGVLRAQHERSILEATDQIRYAQWQEAIKNREGIEQNLENAFRRYKYYERLLGTDAAQVAKPEWEKFDPAWRVEGSSFGTEPVLTEREIDVRIEKSEWSGSHLLNPEEAHELNMMQASQIVQDIATGMESIAAVLNLIPMFGAHLTPIGVGAKADYGGFHLASFLSGLATVSKSVSGRLSFEATLAGKMAGYTRREQDWAFQANAAVGEMNQLYKQLRAAEVREHIAKKEYDNHQLQRKNADDIVEFLSNEKNLNSGDKRKTTDEAFYLWMKGESKALHARAFELAYEVAKKAEAAYAYELHEPSASFVGTIYLAGREGLYAGERLSLDLKAMDVAYLENNRRSLELVKHVSLREWFPLQLALLRKTGTCTVKLPEALFDLDCPNHQFRRIQSVALSIPCVTGPYASVHCNLTLSSSEVRVSDTETRSYAAATTTIVTSGAQNDTGMFETNLRDERYLPFEGAGVNESSWTLSLLGNPRPLDYDTIADAILTIRYIAKAEGSSRENAARGWLDTNAIRAFSLRHEFSGAWARYKRGPAPGQQKSFLEVELEPSAYPYRLRGLTAGTPVRKARQLILLGAGNGGQKVKLTHAGGAREEDFAGAKAIFRVDLEPTGKLTFEIDEPGLEDLWMLVDWSGAAVPTDL